MLFKLAQQRSFGCKTIFESNSSRLSSYDVRESMEFLFESIDRVDLQVKWTDIKGSMFGLHYQVIPIGNAPELLNQSD